MTDKATMWAARASAGAAYASALSALRSAYIELAAYDAALRNRTLGYGERHPDDGGPIRSFAEGGVNAIPAGLLHGEFAPDAMGGINDAVKAKITGHLADLAAP